MMECTVYINGRTIEVTLDRGMYKVVQIINMPYALGDDIEKILLDDTDMLYQPAIDIAEETWAIDRQIKAWHARYGIEFNRWVSIRDFWTKGIK